MVRIQPPTFKAKGTTISRQVSSGAVKKSIGRIGQQRGAKPSQAAVQQKKRRELYQRNKKLAKEYAAKINAGQIKTISQIPAGARPFLKITQGKLDQVNKALARAKEQRARDSRRRKKARDSARRKRNIPKGLRLKRVPVKKKNPLKLKRVK